METYRGRYQTFSEYELLYDCVNCGSLVRDLDCHDQWHEDNETPAQDAGAVRIAQQFHKVYEALAPYEGYKTREESAVPWEDVPEANRRLMIRTVETLLVAGVIKAGDEEEA